MALTTPLINGFYPAYADIVFRCGIAGVGGLQFVGVTDISYDDDLKRSKVYGAQKVPLGLSTGKYEANGSVTFLLSPAQLLIASLSVVGIALGGFRFVPMSVTVSYAAIGPLPLVTDSFTCFLGKQEAKNKVGDDALERTFSLYLPGTISWNGSPGAIDLNSIGAIG